MLLTFYDNQYHLCLAQVTCSNNKVSKIENQCKICFRSPGIARQLLLEGSWRKSGLPDNLKVISTQKWPKSDKMQNKRWGLHIRMHGSILQRLVNCFLKALGGNPECWQFEGNFSTEVTKTWWNAKQKVRNAHLYAWKHSAMARQLLLEGSWRKSGLPDNLKVISTQKWPKID